MSDARNKKIPYPPKVEGYISSRLLKEKLIRFFAKNGKEGSDIDNLIRSTIKRFKIYANENKIPNAIIREGEKGKEQFLIAEISEWLKKRKTDFSKFNID